MCDSAGLIDAGRCSLEASQLCVAIRRDSQVRTAGRCQAADLPTRTNSAAIACSHAVMNSSDRSRRHLPNIGRNEVGIPLACPQICDRTEPVVAEAHVRPSSMARPLPTKPKGLRQSWRRARYRPCCDGWLCSASD